MPEGELRCAFCKKPVAEVRKLIAGPRHSGGENVAICDKCVAICVEILEEDFGPAWREIAEPN